ncbi:gluconate 2-dehydrogenase subunit 3 family protein [Mucilaginibacter psychrotolerans]|uniref:Gluconate 2-dehydrogenase subunit 3 family protein n=1 Tax=Mucilaginibacter psychrotolerans TaxID=1524096 RepID=A0A4Y8S6Y8_9SPHI|nr:gluconate 2-dehydrogenase subunit 3 family protein [Mucilaginibacter psychrotolerans]TFF34134.1 gluconate 2-dehydrogenase subunit 3 family protein [Mucilaginibacter psychrotolerans]
MNRRDAIGRVGLILGGSIIGAEFFMSGCKSGSTANTEDLSKPETTAFLDEVGETILPETSTPGAKAAKVGAFMAVMVKDCYTADDQKVFQEGIGKLDDASNKKFSKKFMEISAAQRTELLTEIDKEAKDYAAQKGKEADADKIKHAGEKDYKAPDVPNHYFTMMKQLTLLGYFTSEVGATKALRYVPVPGKYIGDYPYKKGDRAWALS